MGRRSGRHCSRAASRRPRRALRRARGSRRRRRFGASSESARSEGERQRRSAPEGSGVIHGARDRVAGMRLPPEALALLVVAVLVAGCGGSHSAARHTAATTRATTAARQRRALRGEPVRKLVPVAAGTLDAPVQDAAPAPFGGGAVLLGGLTSSDTSRDSIVTVSRAGSRQVGRLPGVVHDAAAVTIGRLSFLFGGGNGPSRSTRSSGSIRAPAPQRRSATCRPAARTRRARRSAALRTSSAASRARAGSTRSSRGSPEVARESSPTFPRPSAMQR